MELVLLWIGLSIVIGVGAAYRGRSALGWTLLSLVISPLLALLLLLLTPNRAGPKGPTPETHVKCPDCAELVLKEARKCKHCGCSLVPQ